MKLLPLSILLLSAGAALFILLNTHYMSELAEHTVEASLGGQDLDWDDEWEVNLGMSSNPLHISAQSASLLRPRSNQHGSDSKRRHGEGQLTDVHQEGEEHDVDEDGSRHHRRNKEAQEFGEKADEDERDESKNDSGTSDDSSVTTNSPSSFSSSSSSMLRPPKKKYASLLLVHAEEVLLVEHSKRHTKFWAFPGGKLRREVGQSLEDAAKAASLEGLGLLPNFTSLGVKYIRWGRHDEKETSVVVGLVSVLVKQAMPGEEDQEKELQLQQWFSIGTLSSLAAAQEGHTDGKHWSGVHGTGMLLHPTVQQCMSGRTLDELQLLINRRADNSSWIGSMKRLQ